MVLVLATTSKINLVDEALLRSGRFDLKLRMELPEQKERLEILTHLIKKVKDLIIPLILLYFLLKNRKNTMKTLLLKNWRTFQLKWKDFQELILKISSMNVFIAPFKARGLKLR